MPVTIYNNVDAVKALSLALRPTGTVEGDTIDRADTNSSVMFAIISGTITDGTATFIVKDSDDGVTFTAAPTFQQGAAVFAPADGNQVKEIGYSGPKRYCRVSVTTAGGATGGTHGAIAIFNGGRKPNVR